MSYLSIPRLAFSGRFQANVSTVNNDVRHYDNSIFEPRFQEMQTQDALNGWWNPDGTGAFRLIDVTVNQSVTKLGGSDNGDPAVGLWLNAQFQRTAAKLVDLDPQFQMGSAIWGLRVVLTDGKTEYMCGNYLNAPFRDLIFGRAPAGGSGGASAKYTSILTDVEWAQEAEHSAILRLLKTSAEANDNRLSINLMTYGYVGNTQDPNFTYGNLSGSLGTWEQGNPEKFVLGRRFAPLVTPSNPFANGAGIGFFDGQVTGDIVSLDLSNALPLSSTDGSAVDIGPLRLALLKQADVLQNQTINPGVEQGATVSAQELIDLGPVPYTAADWLTVSCGIFDFAVPDEAKPLIDNRTLALVTPTQETGFSVVRIRETNLGLFGVPVVFAQKTTIFCK